MFKVYVLHVLYRLCTKWLYNKKLHLPAKGVQIFKNPLVLQEDHIQILGCPASIFGCPYI